MLPGGTPTRPAAGVAVTPVARGRREKRFWRWFRTLPIMVLVVLALVCGLFSAAPTTLGRTFLYPVSNAQMIEDTAERYGLDPLLVCAVIKCESNWDASAVSSAGAQGLMQLMPATAADLVDLGLVDGDEYDATDLLDPQDNIEFGCAYLSYLQRNLSSTEEMVAAYNAGIGTVQEWIADGGNVPEDISYAETKIYLERVTFAYKAYQSCYPSGLVGTSER